MDAIWIGEVSIMGFRSRQTALRDPIYTVKKYFTNIVRDLQLIFEFVYIEYKCHILFAKELLSNTELLSDEDVALDEDERDEYICRLLTSVTAY